MAIFFLKLPVEAITLLLKNTRNSYKLELIRDCVLAKDISEVARKRIESNYINLELQAKLLNHKFPSHIETFFDEVSIFDQKNNNVLDMMMGVDYKTYMVDDILHKKSRSCNYEC